jgi:hypothetical protein
VKRIIHIVIPDGMGFYWDGASWEHSRSQAKVYDNWADMMKVFTTQNSVIIAGSYNWFFEVVE